MIDPRKQSPPPSPSEKDQLDTTETPLRYAAYVARLKTVLFSAKRYLAYSSDFGEAFRPVVQRRIVNGAYAISWGYVAFDVANEGYKSYKEGDSQGQIAQVVAKRAVFQSLASMALPAFTIHTQVHLFQKITKKIGRFQRWGPTIAGLALVPALPFLFDHPVEHVVDKIFDSIFEKNNEN